MRKHINMMPTFQEHVSYFKWLASYTKPYMTVLVIILVLNTIESLAVIYTAIISKKLIDAVLIGIFDATYIVIYVGIIIGSIGLEVITSLMTVTLYEKYSFGIRKYVYERIIDAKWIEVSKFHTGDLMTRLTSDTRNVTNGITQTLPDIIGLMIQLAVSFGVLFYYEPIVALFALIIGPTGTVIAFLFGRVQKKLQTKVQESEATYRSFLQESLSNILVIKAFTYEKRSTAKLVQLREDRFKWVRKNAKVKIASASLTQLTFQIGYIVAFTIGAMRVADGAITFGTMTLFLTLVNRVQSPVMSLGRSVPKIVSLLTSAGRIIEVQDIPMDTKSDITINQKKIGIRMERLNFGYNKKTLIFDEANVAIEPGDFEAILGESGIGKTTLMRLILAFVDDYEDSIQFYDDQGKSMKGTAAARAFMAYVPQGNTLFSGTVRENILVGNPEATDDEIEEALEVAVAKAFVRLLPDGLNTMIGEKGFGLSEGQAQRIAIARAIVKKAPLLVFDEATSALDMTTEIKLLKGLQSISPRPTCLLITHRETVLAYCNRELRIADQKICICEVL